MKKKKNKHAQYSAYPQSGNTGWNDDANWNPGAWGEGANPYAYGYGMPPGAYPGYPYPGQPYAGAPNPGAPYPGLPNGYPAGNFGAPQQHGAGILGWLGNRQMEQFILGLLLGGAAAYVLGDPEKRARLIRMAMKLYTGVAGSFEEFKEQIADLKAEVAAEQGIDPES